MNVWDLSDNYIKLDELLEASAGELTPEVEEALSTLVTEAPAALERAGNYRRYLNHQIDVAKERRAVLAAAIEATEAKLDRLEAAMVAVLERTGKVKLPEFTLSTQTRTSYAFEVANGADILDVPSTFVRYREPELDKRALTEAAKEGHLPKTIQCVETTKTGLMMRSPSTKKTAETSTEAA